MIHYHISVNRYWTQEISNVAMPDYEDAISTFTRLVNTFIGRYYEGDELSVERAMEESQHGIEPITAGAHSISFVFVGCEGPCLSATWN